MTDVPRLSLLVGGKWLQQYGAWGDLTYSTIWPGGSKEASWGMTTKYASRLSPLVFGADVQVCLGGWPLWRGTLAEPAWSGNTVTLTANGLYRQGENFPAFDSASTMNAITNPLTALGTAIGMGLPWTLGPNIPNTDLATGATTDPANTITELLNQWTLQGVARWFVDPFGAVQFANEPTTPTLVVRNGSGDLGIAPDDYASNVVLRYNDSGAGAYKSVAYPALTASMDAYGLRYGRKISLQDITEQGQMSAATALNLAQNTYTQTKQRPGWTNGLSLAYGEILTPGGVPVHPAVVTASGGVMAQGHGVPDEVALTSYTNFIVGDTNYVEGSGVVDVNPVGLAARTTEDVLAELVSAAISSGSIAA